MSIKMIGIDHHAASVEYREMFAFTKKKSIEAMLKIKEIDTVSGCIVLSTCNRTELWLSCHDGFNHDLYEIISRLKGRTEESFRRLFTVREEEEAVQHLFALASGLKSTILGEDQIITQVKDALSDARENYCTDNVMEVLFRTAVTAAKKVKTEVVLSQADRSVIDHALNVLGKQGFTVKGKKCMVIGNGEMGRLAATTLREAGAEVTVTVRQYRSGVVQIPRGCRRIHYGERMEYFSEFPFVVTATASPNYTVKYKDMLERKEKNPVIIIDLAVPRDVETKVGKLEGVTVYDIDYFKVDIENEQLKAGIAQAQGILQEKMEEFLNWYECRDVIPKIEKINHSAVTDLEMRIRKVIKGISLAEGEKEQLEKSIETAAGKVVAKMMFGLRDMVSEQTFRECISGLEKVYETESE